MAQLPRFGEVVKRAERASRRERKKRVRPLKSGLESGRGNLTYCAGRTPAISVPDTAT